ncbi:MAG: barstar family protein [Sideroxydans sp.]|nr:barstar family protein [Sideroxyarcus sp.]
MTDLCKRLKNVNEAGVYRLNCPLDDLRASAEDCDFVLFEARLADAHGKGEVLAELARAIAAPDWFGHNWDALADALGDLSWKKSPGYVLVLHGEVGGEEILNEILEATVSFWKLQGKAFWVFFT